MSQFDIDLSKALLSIADLNQSLAAAAKATDALEAKFGKVDTSLGQAARRVDAQLERIEQHLKSAGVDVESLGAGFKGAREMAVSSLQKIAGASIDAGTRIAAVTGDFKGLNEIMSKTARDNALVNTFIKVTNASSDLQNTLSVQARSMQLLETADGKLVQVQKAKLAGMSKLLTTETRLQLSTTQLTKDLEVQATAEGRAHAVSQARLSTLRSEQQESTKLAGTLGTLQRRQTGQTAALQDSIAVQRASNAGRDAATTAVQRQANQYAELRRQADAMGTTLGRQILLQSEKNSATGKAITFAQRETSQLAEARRVSESYSTGKRVELDLINQSNRSKQQAVTFEARMMAQGQETLRVMQSMSSGLARQTALLAEATNGSRAAATFNQRQANTVAELNRQIESLANGGYAKEVAALTLVKKSKEQLANQSLRERLEIDQLQRTLASATAGRRREAAVIKERIKAADAAATAVARESTQLAELKRQIESLNNGARSHILLLTEQKRAREAEVTEEARQITKLAELERQLRSLNGGIGESIVRQQELVNQRKRAIREEVTGAAATRELERSRNADARATKLAADAQARLKNEHQLAAEKLARLRAEYGVLSGARSKEIAQVQAQIAHQKELNRLKAMSLPQMLGLVSATRQHTSGMTAANQTGAMLRATMAGMQTSIGMYTSSTILAASATYAIARAIRSSLQVGTEFGATMSRVQAIMGGSLGKGMSTGMEAMEDQVRSLGQTTIFTASEVAEGVRELGMAGLSAGQAMVALQPALDMAMIGAISMGQSADIATNVMMTFNLEAKDLTHVVDVMAMAITNSNTTIEQLANAISYVGPAAEAAGISLEDTTAAIEVLSNTGIKASRAGTGLRRMFSNMLNPTAKGAKMLREYGISITDMDGQTRDLTSVLGQLNQALYADGVQPAERLAAVVDLVGVRAASAVSALIGQGGTGGAFTTLRTQLDAATGAAERMRETIQDNLAADWKQVISSFQEVQLTAMTSQEARLRLASVRISAYLVSLTDPIDGTDITKLDVILQRVENITIMVGKALAGYAAFKFLSGSIFKALATDLRSAANMVAVLTTQKKAVNVATLQYIATGEKAALLTRRATTQITLQTRALEQLNRVRNATAAGAVGAASTTASVFAAGTKLLGWVGLLAGVGWALKDIFSKDATRGAEEQKNAVTALTAEYKRYADAIKESATQRKIASLQAREEELRGDINVKEGDVTRGTRSLAQTTRLMGGDDQQAIDLRQQIRLDEMAIKRLKVDLDGVQTQLAREQTTQLTIAEIEAKRRDIGEERIRQQQKLQDMQEALRRAEGSSGTLGAGIFARQEAIKRQTELVEQLGVTYGDLGNQVASAEERLISLDGTMREHADGLASALLAVDFEMNATPIEKLLDSRKKLAEAEKSYQESINAREQMEAGFADEEISRDEARRRAELERLSGTDVMLDRLKARDTAAIAARKLENDFAKERRTAEEAAIDAKQTLAELDMSEAELLLTLRERYTELTNEIAVRQAMSYDEAAIAGLESEAEMLSELIALRQRISGITSKATRTTRDPAAEKLKSDLDAARGAFKSMLSTIDPVRASLEDMNAKIEQMNLLRREAPTEFSESDHAAALRQLRLAHFEVVQAQDKHRESLQSLRDTYNESPFQSTLDDLAKLNALLREGRIELEEYDRMKAKMLKSANESVIGGAPTVDFRMQGDNSSPFNEMSATYIDQAEGQAWYNTQDTELRSGYEDEKMSAVQRAQDQMATLQALRDAEAIDAVVHAERMKEIALEQGEGVHAANVKFASQNAALIQSRAQYEEQMGQMVMMSMLSTAEGILGMFAATGEQATTAQKAAFIAQKAISVAMIIMNTHLAAAQMATALPGPAGLALAAKVKMMGYASAGLVAALSIGQLTGGGSSGGGGGYAGAYDKGGWIPAGKWGVVGEYGPEMVHGPANVTGRERTASKLGGGGDSYDITLAPNFTIEVSGDQGSDSVANGQEIGRIAQGMVMSTMREQMRPNGMLDQWLRSARRG